MQSLTDIFTIFNSDKEEFFHKLIVKLFGGWMPDKLYLSILYRLSIGKWPNLNNPQTYNEKLQWLKLHDHNPIYSVMVDKYAVKDYVGKIIGQEYIIPTLGVWNRLEDIDFDALPDQFVLKTTFGGGGDDLIICKDKRSFDKDSALKHMKLYMNQNYLIQIFKEYLIIYN